MLYSSSHIFIHLPKNGGSSIRNYLGRQGWKNPSMPMGYKAWWHRPYFMCPAEVAKGRIPVVLVRNPWDYYVSYWSYEGNKTMLRALYGNSFEDFLRNLLNGKSKDIFHLPQKIQLPIAQLLFEKDIGLQTFYYLYMTYNEDPRSLLISNSKFDISNFKTPIKTYKLENLDRDFAKIFGMHSTHQEKFANSKKQNQSRRNKDYRVYYTPELRQLVAEREKYIIEKFNYSF
jgi:hypothetical protein